MAHKYATLLLTTNLLFFGGFSRNVQAEIKSCDLATEIEQITQQPEFRATHWGIAIQDLQTEQLLYQKNAHQAFIPASNLKLFTTAAALQQLGENYQFETQFFTTGAAPNLDTLLIRGGGDPSLSTEKLATAIAQLKSAGILSINQLIIDDSYFTDPPIHPTWEWSDLPAYYASPASSLSLNENTFQVTLTPSTIGQPATLKTNEAIALGQWHLENQLITAPAGTAYSGKLLQDYTTNHLLITGEIAADAGEDIWWLSIPKPPEYFRDTFIYLLGENGITVHSNTITQTPIHDLENPTLFTTLQSDSLATILQEINRNSNNLFAENLRHTLQQTQPSPNSSGAIATILSDMGINTENLVIRDGSGLSRHNLVTPLTVVQLLDVMADHPDAEIYKNSLAIAGQEGTLRRRFQGSPVAGHFFGKTGTMTHVGSLSGYLDLPNGNTLILSIFANQTAQSNAIIRQSLDAIVSATHHWGTTCPVSIQTTN